MIKPYTNKDIDTKKMEEILKSKTRIDVELKGRPAAAFNFFVYKQGKSKAETARWLIEIGLAEAIKAREKFLPTHEQPVGLCS